MNIPRRALVGEPIGGGYFDSKRPSRGLRTSVAISPVVPPTRWTGPEPGVHVYVLGIVNIIIRAKLLKTNVGLGI